MARKAKVLNDAKSKIIEENILKENPDGLPDKATGLVIAKYVPEYRKVIFLNGRDPGVALHFHYHSKTHPLKNYTLYHGLEHELPVEIIDHLETCAEPQYAYRKNIEGHTEHYIKTYKYIFQFKTVKKAA
jgi:hypothetical protein